MRKIIPALICTSILLTGCSTGVSETPESGDAQSGVVVDAKFNEFVPVEKEDSPIAQNTEGGSPSSLTEAQVSISVDTIGQLLNIVFSTPSKSAELLEATGIPRESLIQGEGTEATRDTLASGIPMNLMYVGEASLQEEIAAYTYLLIASSLTNYEGIPPYITIRSDLAEVSDNEVTIPQGGESISFDAVDSRAFHALSYVLATPFTVVLYEEGKESAGTYDKWGVKVSDLGKSAIGIGLLQAPTAELDQD